MLELAYRRFELRAPVRFHAVPDGDDDIEVVELDLTMYVASALALSLCEFCTSWPAIAGRSGAAALHCLDLAIASKRAGWATELTLHLHADVLAAQHLALIGFSSSS